MFGGVARVFTGDKGKFDLFHTGEERLDDPARDFRGIVLDLLHETEGHLLVKVTSPIGFVGLVLQQGVDILIDNLNSGFLIRLVIRRLDNRL